MSEESNSPIEIPLTPKTKKPLVNKIINISMVVLAIILVTLLILKSQHATISNECCEQVCSGMNMQCDYPSGQDIFCSFSYARYGLPYINEVVRFHINNQTAACAPPIINTTPVSTTNQSICENNTCTIGGNQS